MQRWRAVALRQRNGDGMKQYLLGVLHRRSFSSLAADDVLKPSGLVDSFGRKHTYLRISLTEKCNLRCVYCMPEHGVKLTAKERLMTLEERKRAISLFVDQGINKLRFTGGEPTVSNQLSELISFARERISFVAITSNGIMLRDQLRGLLDAGLTSVNISLDTLEEKKFAAITRRDGKLLRKVMASIYGAVAAGLPVKVNIVIMRGTNDDEMHRFVALTKDMPIDVRFIELMPFDGNEWSPTSFVGYLEIIDRLRMEQGVELQRDGKADLHDTTKWYRAAGAAGRVGFITSMSSHFCGGCNRLRLTADGKLKVCLFGQDEISLLDAMRSASSCSDQHVSDLIHAAVYKKKAKLGGHDTLADLASATNRPMILIGG